jgi:glycosyltransferase involved in cell wall biosynthesis
MKIVHVTARYFPNVGGVETIVKELCENLAAKGFDVRVYSLDLGRNASRQELINGVKVRRYRHLLGDPFFVPTLAFLRDLREEKPSILHVHNIQNLFPLFVSLVKTREQIQVMQPHYHGYGQTATRQLLLSIYKKVIPKLVFSRSQAIIANSKYEERLLKNDFSLVNQIHFVPEGLSMGELGHVKLTPEHPDRILYVGALKKYKKVDLVLRAFRIMLEHEGTPARLVIVGDGPERNRLNRLATELAIDRFVEWKRNLGRQAVLMEYSRARVFVMLSTFETFSIAVNESLALGIPAVVSACGVFSDLVSQGVVEGVFSEKPEELAAAILKARTKGVKTINKAEIPFQDIKDYTNQIGALYKSLWNGFR